MLAAYHWRASLSTTWIPQQRRNGDPTPLEGSAKCWTSARKRSGSTIEAFDICGIFSAQERAFVGSGRKVWSGRFEDAHWPASRKFGRTTVMASTVATISAHFGF